VTTVHHLIATRRYVHAVLRRRATDDVVAERLARLERRLDDLEDTVAAAVAPDRVDDVVGRLDELALTASTADDIVRVRIEVARLAAELSRVRAELQQQLDNVTSAMLDLTDPRVAREHRAAG